ncbi:MAG: hypothetical protein H3C54_02030 [Taibaiella sp.]|nr:hypothetical protein [Taibaiella sp.]
MNKLVITFCILLLSSVASAQPTEVQAKKLQGYFFSGSDAMLKDGPNCFVITKKQEFEKLFGKGRADTPNFSKEWMLVLLMPATKKDIQLEFNRISMKAGTFVEVYCDFNKLRGKMLTYETNPIAVCTIPRFEKVKTINFYEERKKGLELVTSVEVKH